MQPQDTRQRLPRQLGLLLGSLGSFASLLQLASAAVSSTAELARGEHVARLVCSACHVVASDQEYAPILTKPAPSFLDIANRPGVSAQSLQHFVTTTHWDVDKLPMTMPNPMLSKNDAQAVSSYIVSLRKR